MCLQKIAKKNKNLLKSLGVNVKGLVGYHKLYGTTPNTFGYKGSSVWFCSISEYDKTIEINTTYFKYTKEILRYNKIQNKKYSKNKWGMSSDIHGDAMTKFKEGLPLNINDRININIFSIGYNNYRK